MHAVDAQGRVDFWILWSALLVGMGAGFTMLNNLSQMVESLGGGAPNTPFLLAHAGPLCMPVVARGYSLLCTTVPDVGVGSKPGAELLNEQL
jgi:uncharacterized membrane protein YhaH (DUF805 family)